MSETTNKTKHTGASVNDFLSAISDPNKRRDSIEIVKILQQVSGDKPEMWGSSIIGFGLRNIKYSSGREMEWMRVGFSPRKSSLTLYLNGLKKIKKELLLALGKHKISGGCLHIKQLSDVDINVLRSVLVTLLKN